MAIKETNLIPYEGEIKAGQRLVKVGDSWMPVGVGGMFEPGSVQFIEVGVGVYYQCVSVDSDTAWSGKKWEMVDGIYVLAEAVTSNLPYGTGFTPAVGTSYNADATVRVDKMFEGASALPEDGMVFWLPFNGNAEPAVGTVTSTTGELTYGEVNGIKYAQFRKSQYFEGCKATQDTVDAFTVACTVRVPSDATSYYSAAIIDNIVPPDTSYITGIDAYAYGDNARVHPSGGGLDLVIIDRGVFVSAIVVYDADGNGFFYVNGNCVSSGTRDAWKDGANVSNMIIGRGRESTSTEYLADSDVADVAVWNRVLTEEEIAQVAARAASMNG